MPKSTDEKQRMFEREQAKRGQHVHSDATENEAGMGGQDEAEPEQSDETEKMIENEHVIVASA